MPSAARVEPTRYSYAGCLKVGDGPAKRDVATAVSLFERLGDEGLLEAKVDCRSVLRRARGLVVNAERERDKES